MIRKQEALDYHELGRPGKIEVIPTKSCATQRELSLAYTPGVARVCMAIHKDPEKAYTLTIKQNTVAVVSDGSAVLGLGDIGPNGAQPVMEGKALLFKRDWSGARAALSGVPSGHSISHQAKYLLGVVAMREAHLAFANSLSGLLGKPAPGTPLEAVLTAAGPGFQGDPTSVIKAAADLESTAVATHTDVLSKLQGVNGAALIASIQIAEARHTTVLRDLAGSTDLAELLVDTEAASLLGNG